MTKRREPTLSTGAGRAEPRAEGARQANPAAQPQRRKAPPPPPPPPPEYYESREPSMGLSAGSPQIIERSSSPIPLILVFLILAAGLGFTYWQLMQSQQALGEATARIQDLESRLDMTGDETEASSAAVQAKLKWADSEIRKLWGVSYDRNRKAIADNTTKVDAMSAKIDKVSNDIKGSIDAEIKKQTKGLTSEVVVLSEMMTATQESVRNVSGMKKQMDNLVAREAGLRKDVQRNSEAVESFDAYRQTVNRKLLELQQR